MEINAEQLEINNRASQIEAFNLFILGMATQQEDLSLTKEEMNKVHRQYDEATVDHLLAEFGQAIEDAVNDDSMTPQELSNFISGSGAILRTFIDYKMEKLDKGYKAVVAIIKQHDRRPSDPKKVKAWKTKMENLRKKVLA